MKQLFLFLLILSVQLKTMSQENFRMKADFTVKIANSNGSKNLTKGVVYYDKNIKQLIYNISFPKEEKWVSKDTSLYKYNNNILKERITIPSINEFTVFHLALNSDLNDFGLKNSVYAMNKVEKNGDLTLAYWKIPAQASTFMDYVVIIKKNNRLESVFMMGKNKKPLSKQYFRNYTKIGVFEFPQQIVQIVYDKTGKENYQVTEFKNISINELTNNQLYKFIQ